MTNYEKTDSPKSYKSKKEFAKCAWHLGLHSNATADPFGVCLSLVTYIVQEKCAECVAHVSLSTQKALVEDSTYWAPLVSVSLPGYKPLWLSYIEY